MANIKISELNPLVTIQDADVLPIVDNAITKKVTAAILRSYTEGNSVLLTTAQTVAGIKTFTAQLASTVATGTAPFSVASTTKVTNLNADLLDGLSSADFALSTRTLTAGTGLTGGGDLTANRTFAIDSTVATLTGTQTLTNKTITSPVINEILDSNGNEILGFTPIASATDYITIKNGIGVGVPLHISAAGSSTNTGLHLEPKGSGLVQISDGTDTSKGFRFRSSGSAASAVTLLDAVSSAGRVITLPDATTTLVGTNTTDTLSNKSISGATNTLSNIGNASLTNSAITINGTSTSLGGSINVGTVTSVAALTLGTSGTDVSSSVATGTTTPVITLNVPTASASNRGALSSTDWSTFNAKQNAITLTTTGTSGAATLVGSTLNIPNYADTDTGITSLNGLTALTQTFAVGSSGTDFGISSATSTHTFNLPTASATNRGALSSADWTTFNNKTSNLGTVTSVGLTSATSGVTIGASPVTTSGDITLAIATATSGQNGLLSSTDWTTFNNKQNALTNPITGTGTTNYLPKFTGASALGDSLVFSNSTSVGINTTTPNLSGAANGLSINSTGYSVLELNQNNARAFFIYSDAGQSILGTFNSADLIFRTNDTARLTLNGATGAATFSSSVTANGDLSLPYGSSLRGTGGTYTKLIESGFSGSDYVSFYTIGNNVGNATPKITMLSGGNIGIGTTSPAEKLSVSGAIMSTGAITGHGANRTTLSQEGSNGAYWQSYGADASTVGTFSLRQASSDFSIVRTPLHITSAGNVGIGTTTPTTYSLAGKHLEVFGGSDFAFIHNNTTTVKSFLATNESALTTALFTFSNHPLTFGTNNTERMRITAAGNVQLQQGLSLNAATAPASGIEFPATQVASASANNLDDYEEGTWTMGLSFGGGTTGITYSNNTGTYTKVGRQVTVNGYMLLSSKGSSTGNVLLTGLPFTIPNSSNNLSTASFWLNSITFLNQHQGVGLVNSTNIEFWQITNLGAASVLNNTNFANNSEVIVNFTYFV